MKRIVAAIDHSEASLRAADLAAELAGKYGAQLVLLLVGRDIGAPDAGVEAYAKIEHIQERTPTLVIESLRETLTSISERATAHGARHVSTEVAVGDPAEQILAFAKDERADLIVMGSRGHGRLAGLLLGSATQKVVPLATCPVLVVH